MTCSNTMQSFYLTKKSLGNIPPTEDGLPSWFSPLWFGRSTLRPWLWFCTKMIIYKKMNYRQISNNLEKWLLRGWTVPFRSTRLSMDLIVIIYKEKTKNCVMGAVLTFYRNIYSCSFLMIRENLLVHPM